MISISTILVDKRLNLKSASEHYEETKNNLQKMCESIEKISQTNQKLVENMSLAIAEMEKTNLENKKTQEFMQNLYDEAKHVFEAEAQRHEASVQTSLAKKFNEISFEVRKQTDKILQNNANQSEVLNQISEEFGKQIKKIHQNYANQFKSMRLLKAMAIVAIVLEAVIIIRMFLF